MAPSRPAAPAGPRPGRPRSEQSRTAVLRATSELLHEVGLRGMTTEQIASRSGTSKATIYKWWSNKYSVAVDAFLSEMMAESADPDTGSTRDDLRAVLAGPCAPVLRERAALPPWWTPVAALSDRPARRLCRIGYKSATPYGSCRSSIAT
jgi:AcrR family transcriptional regulator